LQSQTISIFPTTAIPLEVFLVYDEGNKDVDFVSVKPVECKTSVSQLDKGVITMEVKIKVLSSQLEDSLFRIKVIARKISLLCLFEQFILSRNKN